MRLTDYAADRPIFPPLFLYDHNLHTTRLAPTGCARLVAEVLPAPARTPYTTAYTTDDGRLMLDFGRQGFIAEAVATRFGLVKAFDRATPEAKAARLPARKLRRRIAQEAKTRAILKALTRSL